MLTITITQGVDSALPIAVVPFVEIPGDAASREIARTLREVIGGDLSRSGRFRVVDESRYPQQPGDFASIDFPAWQKSGAQTLVVGRLQPSTAGAVNIEFRLVDLFGATQLLGYRIPLRQQTTRTTGHQIADLIYEQLIGEPGVFSSRIAYVSVDTMAGAKVYRLNIADSDGFNPQTLLESREPVLSPAWSPDGRRLAYASLEGSRATLFLQDLRSGHRQAIASGQGLHSAPAFSRDGKQLALTISRDGNPDIHLYSLASGELRRLTTDPAIDTEPTFAPDGRRIAFTSDRGGGPQIYTVDTATGQTRRLTYGMGSYNARPRYSPDGKSMAVVTRSSTGFQIGLIDLERRLLTSLTSGRLDESPTFAPNGRLIMYATRDRRGSELAVVSVDGRVKQRLGLSSSEVREPAWGPLPRR